MPELNPETLKRMKEACEEFRNWNSVRAVNKFRELATPANVSALIADYERLKEALEDANGLCRSAMAIAKRQGIQTNWDAFERELEASLRRQHEVMYPATDLAQQQREVEGEG